MIEPGKTREPTYRCLDRRPGDRTGCGALMRGPAGRHGALCPSCESGRLANVALVTRKMLERAETAA